MHKISCIIPAYNERVRIGRVLEVVTTHPHIAEVIVVDDRSTDGTGEVVKRFPSVKLITQEKNQGKSKAIHDGIQASTGDVLLFLDADLIGLTVEAVTDLIDPIYKDEADVSISLRENAPLPWKWIGLDYISGERVLHKKMIESHIEKIPQLSAFGLEVFLNAIIIKAEARIKVPYWKGVHSPFKHVKRGLWGGTWGEVLMMRDIFKTVSPYAALRQIIDMRKLRV